jgi:hypothetical protein
MPAPLSIWTVYAHPIDYPLGYLARRFEAFPTGARATLDIITAPTLEEIRGRLAARGLSCLSRNECDEPHIVESWL